ncbi:MAG: hypothetical protein H7Y03_04980 [Chitinophagaceae bacterium]|nr:hypothetical protein [Chitinophagaceae bacterium]
MLYKKRKQLIILTLVVNIICWLVLLLAPLLPLDTRMQVMVAAIAGIAGELTSLLFMYLGGRLIIRFLRRLYRLRVKPLLKKRSNNRSIQ